MKHVLLASIILLLQPVLSETLKTDEGTSRLHNLGLKTGMNREPVEKMIAARLGKPSTYSPYGNNLRGGTVEYRDGDWLLKIKYKSGTPAPWVENPDGSRQHYPPVDETVLEFTLKKLQITNKSQN